MQRALMITRFQQSEYADLHTVGLTVQIPCTWGPIVRSHSLRILTTRQNPSNRRVLTCSTRVILYETPNPYSSWPMQQLAQNMRRIPTGPSYCNKLLIILKRSWYYQILRRNSLDVVLKYSRSQPQYSSTGSHTSNSMVSSVHVTVIHGPEQVYGLACV